MDKLRFVIPIVGRGILDAPVILRPKITSPKVIIGWFPYGNAKKSKHFLWRVKDAAPYGLQNDSTTN